MTISSIKRFISTYFSKMNVVGKGEVCILIQYTEQGMFSDFYRLES